MTVWTLFHLIFSLIVFNLHLIGQNGRTSDAQAHKVQQYYHFPHPTKRKGHSVKNDIVLMRLSEDTPFTTPTLTDLKFRYYIQKRTKLVNFQRGFREKKTFLQRDHIENEEKSISIA